jgi:ubiquinone/menaquinone biosynthesis C-methylase UbiE
LKTTDETLDIGVGGLPQGSVNIDVVPNPNANLLADAHHLPLRAAAFNHVVICHVLEHVKDPRRVLAEIHRVLHDGGTVTVEYPKPFFRSALVYAWLSFIFNPHYWILQRGETFRCIARIIRGIKSRHPGYTHLWIMNRAIVDKLFRVDAESFNNAVFPKPFTLLGKVWFSDRFGLWKSAVHLDCTKVT